jgi:lysine/ornithine N-monooxygenase
MSNGEILTKVKRQQLEIKVVDNHETIRIIETDQVVMFRSRALVIGNGGVQGLHPELFNWFPDLNPEKTIASDEFLRRDGFIKHVHRLSESRSKKVVIIGGSHSGFSCTWMLLNGPATYYNNNAGI